MFSPTRALIWLAAAALRKKPKERERPSNAAYVDIDVIPISPMAFETQIMSTIPYTPMEACAMSGSTKRAIRLFTGGRPPKRQCSSSFGSAGAESSGGVAAAEGSASGEFRASAMVGAASVDIQSTERPQF
jgi:hypothetical protein